MKWEPIKDEDWAGGGYYQCPHCKYGFSFNAFPLAYEEFYYCPHCGSLVIDKGDKIKLNFLQYLFDIIDKDTMKEYINLYNDNFEKEEEKISYDEFY